MRFTVKVPGSCGELVQGTLNGKPFLITCPVNLFTAVTISDEFTEHIGLSWKATTMLAKVLEYLGCSTFDFGIVLESELPIGKGMASSSADIAAIGKAAALALGTDLTAEEIATLAVSIEPTDGVFYGGIVAMNPLTGQLLSNINLRSEYKIAIFDFGGKVDTLDFKRQSNLNLTKLPSIFDFDMTTLSALANQTILRKPYLEDIILFAKSMGALGVTNAHTGTVIGVIFAEDTNQTHIEDFSSALIKKFAHITFLAAVNLINGGFYLSHD
ncbi:MAG: GHMP kinase [Selenomonadaceae bacterium]|nr:GHMP kinase [Selenomonadaceae bacterium]